MSKVFAHVDLADGLAQQAVGETKGAFPAGLALLLSAQHAAVEVERGLAKIIAQVVAGTSNQDAGHVVAHLLLAEFGHQVVGHGHHLWLGQDNRFHGGSAHQVEVFLPVDGGIVLLQLVECADVIEFVVVAGLGAVHLGLGKLVLDVINGLAGATGVLLAVAGEHKHLCQEVLVGLLDLLAVGVGVQVVVPVRQAAGTGFEPHHVQVTVLKVGLHGDAKERITNLQVLVGQEAGQILLLERFDLGQVGHQRLCALTVQAVAVHCHLVEVGHLLVDGAHLVLGLAEFEEHVAQAVLVLLDEHIEHAVTGILRVLGQRIGLHPATTCILIEIVTWLYAQVHVSTVHAMRHLCLYARHCSHHYGHC